MSKLILMRGDTHQLKFPRRDDKGDPIPSQAPAVYFTVKNNISNKNAVLQKTIEDMTFNTETGYYTFTIEPSDTDNLPPGHYDFDIEIVIPEENYKRTISKGEILIVADVTRPINEVTSNERTNN